MALPGGFGTLDEVFEALTLIQTNKIHDFPVILFGTDFWDPLVEWLRQEPLRRRMISKRDLNLFHVTDDIDEVESLIRTNYERRRKRRGAASAGRETP